KQIRELAAKEENPSILVNLSNDGWFREGMQIDGHLATHVFRAVENRRTVLSATHGGFSVWIDPAGRIRQQGARNSTEIVWADVVPLPPPEPVFHPGDWLPGLSAALGGMVLVFQLLFGWFFRKKKAPILVDPTEPR
ncbi:MAG: hypothetical protein IKW74_04860, partial [Thermoguttaceae bacterium]|nr:hypothetical protein [Thermoguttaceae bacterium]